MEDDALSQFMGQSQIGGGDDQSMIAGHGGMHGQSNMMSLKPPQQNALPTGKRQS